MCWGFARILDASFWPKKMSPDTAASSYWPTGFGAAIFMPTREWWAGSSLSTELPIRLSGVLGASFHFPAQLGQLTSFGRRLDFFEPLNGKNEDERDLIGQLDFAAIRRLPPPY